MAYDGIFYNKSSELLFNSLDFDILLVSKDFKILFANDAFLKRSGMKRKDVIGRHCYEITHKLTKPCKPPKDPCPIQKVIRTGKTIIVTHTHLTKKGKCLVNVTASPLRNKDGLCFLHISMPVSESKTASMKKAMKKTKNILNVLSLYQRQLDDLKKTKDILEEKVDELERFNKLTINRELKMIELKKKIRMLENESRSGIHTTK
ncbi:MAG: PAS domain-containing protein [Candidatus Aenigmatarchaeota archaeon]